MAMLMILLNLVVLMFFERICGWKLSFAYHVVSSEARIIFIMFVFLYLQKHYPPMNDSYPHLRNSKTSRFSTSRIFIHIVEFCNTKLGTEIYFAKQGHTHFQTGYHIVIQGFQKVFFVAVLNLSHSSHPFCSKEVKAEANYQRCTIRLYLSRAT